MNRGEVGILYIRKGDRAYRKHCSSLATPEVVAMKEGRSHELS